MLNSYFVNPTQSRLRAGWRILAFLVFFIVLNIAGQTVVKGIYGGVPQTSDDLRTAILVVLLAVSATVAVPLARRFLDKRSVVSLGLRLDAQAAKDGIFGFLLSGAMAGAFFLVVLATGLIEVSGIDWGGPVAEDMPYGSFAASLAVMTLGTLAFLFLIDALVSWWEELVFRGYLLQSMIDGLGLWVAVGLSCVLYGLIHMANPNAGLLSGAIIVLFGYVRIYGYLATRMLWLSMGMHLGWNFFQGPVFGFAASGHETATLIAQTPRGPDWLSGGAFGPEGSVLIVPILGLALLAMRWWAGRTRVPTPTDEAVLAGA